MLNGSPNYHWHRDVSEALPGIPAAGLIDQRLAAPRRHIRKAVQR